MQLGLGFRLSCCQPLPFSQRASSSELLPAQTLALLLPSDGPIQKKLGSNGAVPLAAGTGSLDPLPTFSTLAGHPPKVTSGGQGLCPLGPWEPAQDQMSMFSTPPIPFLTAPLPSGGWEASMFSSQATVGLKAYPATNCHVS